MKYEKFDILKKAKYSIIPNNRELYIVYVECDANDGDYMRDTLEFDKSSFEEDELLLLVLSYVSKYSGKFKIANQEITVVIEEILPNNNYGYFCDATNMIKLARTLKTEHDGVVTVSDEQMRNTFYHELFHAFQFYFNNEFNEAQAQVYANFMCEFIETTEEPF